MTREHKILLILGSLFIAFIIAAGAFSLGVYVGTEGLLHGGQPSQQAQQQVLPGQQTRAAQQQPEQAVAGPPDLVGRVMRIEDHEIIIRTAAGIRTVQLALETRYLRHDSGQTTQAIFSDLQSGSQIAVYTVSSNDRRSMIAMAIVLLP